MMQYIEPGWAPILANNQIDTFDKIWNLDLPYVDEGNHARGGHSVVSKYAIQLPEGKRDDLYIKRQENYRCFSWRNPWRGRPTAEREFVNWQRFQTLGLPTYELVYFAKRRVNGNTQAILVSRALPAHDLSSYIQAIKEPHYCATEQTFRERKKITLQVARLLRLMHAHGLRHNHLIPKHIFIGTGAATSHTYMIDLEFLKYSIFRRENILHDLGHFAKHVGGGSLTDKMRFYKAYFEVDRLSKKDKRWWRAIHRRVVG